MAAIPADVNPPILIWAREQSGYSSDLVAKRLGVRLDRVVSWERGERKPTVRQVQELAKYYHRPFGVFFLPQPPTIQPLAAEYRRLLGVRPGVESPEFRLAFRVMSRRREVTIELNEELGVTVPEFSTAAHMSEAPATVGKRLRTLLGLTVEEQQGWRDEWQAWRRWRSSIEDAGVLVFQFPKVPLDQARGVSLLDFPLPAIGINSKEQAPGARIYTLVHELTHIALALGYEERVALRETRTDAQWQEVECFAEEAASEAIIPGEYVSSLKPRKGGFASPVDKTLGRGGRPFAQLVIEALDSNRITAVDASRYLDLRFDHIEKLRSELHTDTSGAGIDDGA